VTALSVPLDTGRMLLPMKKGTSDPVNTFDQPVTLKAGHVQPVRVAYLDLSFQVDVRDGSLYRNGQPILSKSRSDYGN
jgi:hypothetical protein